MSPVILLQLFLLVSATGFVESLLIYKPGSVVQITMSLSSPVDLPGRKLFMNWSLQMNYDLPYNLSFFYNTPIWPGKFNNRKRREVEQRIKCDETFWNEAAHKYQQADIKVEKHPSDFTAGELYHGFENLLASYGFHETCLLRSVCELAHHPFSSDKQNILTEILTFILTPSIHEAFAPSEIHYRETYEESERQGFLHYNCAELYFECKQDLLTLLTNVLTNFKRDHNYEN